MLTLILMCRSISCYSVLYMGYEGCNTVDRVGTGGPAPPPPSIFPQGAIPPPPPNFGTNIIIIITMRFVIYIPAITAANFQAPAQILTSEISIVHFTRKKTTNMYYVTEKNPPPPQISNMIISPICQVSLQPYIPMRPDLVKT